MPGQSSFAGLKQLASTAGKGLLLQMMPGMAGGALNQFFHEWHVDKDKIWHYVENDISLWSDLNDEQRANLHDALATIGRVDFITPQWVITSIKADFTEVAGLFLSSPAAAEWLVRQVHELKAGIDSQPA